MKKLFYEVGENIRFSNKTEKKGEYIRNQSRGVQSPFHKVQTHLGRDLVLVQSDHKCESLESWLNTKQGARKMHTLLSVPDNLQKESRQKGSGE